MTFTVLPIRIIKVIFFKIGGMAMRFIIGLVATVFIWVFALIPVWIFLGARSFTNPEGFWQNIVLLGVGFWVLGGAQVVFAVVGLAATVVAWSHICE
ncbi:MAG: hypothetical protein A2915_00625 [Candidatus Yanofskybacteria bacterium RIFCSPLOWO2_01_FULL_41_34]|uniref:Uncharacterized protein n=1 Tax=Candidatus Yanofskybacteria bacterium RIFCSPHIGHO2_01_FULL_41_26 TaxID=1802661 RepID=A0A1F8EC23_9BACT|nr:MAG: hypothetical protein A2649_02655 [Candidatus Yanofskybacteria bacterium RIFCSPHIGHO2_01_FULL_41_26]OGN22402.1 MAG: hypothetical protein A2915_00625 [Candidatus Yanofskybacteria bacterium RIFCSPLOWO2_01_FULL_41_34]